MANTLYQQNRFFRKKWFELKEEGIFIKTTDLNGTTELLMKFEDTGVKLIKSKMTKRGWLIATLTFFLMAVAMYIYEKFGGDTDKNSFIIYLILSAISGIVFFLTGKRSFYLANNDNRRAIEFLVNKPSKAELSDFIDLFKQTRKNVLLHKFGQLTRHISYEQQMNTLQWLNNIDALTNEEYDLKISELNVLFNPVRPVIGFQTRTD